MSLRRALFKSLIYIFVNAFFGLAPLWVIFQGTLYNYEFDYKEVLSEGMIMFFCIAFIGGISFDYSISKIKHKDDILKYFAIAGPLFLLVFVAINFMQLHNQKNINIDFSTINILQWMLVCITIGYCFIFKTFMFIHEEKQAEK